MGIPAALARRRDYAGPAIFSYGFRPFFMGGAVWAALAILLWIPLYTGHLVLPSAISPLHWHVHEMLYGYVAAVIAGFLLTAIPNWTGRLPVNGLPLAGLAVLWLAGRIAMLSTASIGLVAAAVIDVSFLADDDRVPPLADQLLERQVDALDERTRRVVDLVPFLTQLELHLFGRAVGGQQHRACLHLVGPLRPRRTSSQPARTRFCSATRSVERLTPSCAASSRSAGSLSPGLSSRALIEPTTRSIVSSSGLGLRTEVKISSRIRVTSDE